MLYWIVFVADTWNTTVLSNFPDFSLLSLSMQPVVGLPGLCWAALCLLDQLDSLEIKSSCQISSLPKEQAVGTSISLKMAADCRLDFVSLWKPPFPTLEITTDLVLWQSLTWRNNTEMRFERGEELLSRWGGGHRDTSACPRQSMAVQFCSGIPKAWRAGALGQLPLLEQEAEPQFPESPSA